MKRKIFQDHNDLQSIINLWQLWKVGKIMIHVKTLLYVICQNNNFLDTTKNMKSVSIFNLVPVMTSYLFEFFPPVLLANGFCKQTDSPLCLHKKPWTKGIWIPIRRFIFTQTHDPLSQITQLKSDRCSLVQDLFFTLVSFVQLIYFSRL